MDRYKVLDTQRFDWNGYSIVPIRMEDRYDIMQWRNDQIFHLRQKERLTKEVQDNYFENVVSKQFGESQPNQILFSYLKDSTCIGYGGLVHINWTDKHAEISFLMNTSLEKDFFEVHWLNFLKLIERVAFDELDFKKIYTYAFDLRPRLYEVLHSASFVNEARLKDHCLFNHKFIDVLIHSKFNIPLLIREAEEQDLEITFKWATNSKVRQYALNQDVIQWDDHKKWFINKIQDPSCFYFIAQEGNNIIGSVRFDIDDEGKGLISFLVDPAFHGKGYGTKLLQKSIKHLRLISEVASGVYGYVLKNNIASAKIFEKLGFENISEDSEKLKFFKELK